VIQMTDGAVTVREWRGNDAPAIVAQANDRRVSIQLRDLFPYPYGLRDAKRFLAMVQAKRPPTSFAIDVDGRIAGGIGYGPGTDVERIGAEVGYWLGHEFWGHGYATSAVRLITGHAFRARPELRRLFAVPFTSNAASARVLEKVGYRCEGTLRQSAIKDGHVHDQWMYALLRDEWEARSEGH
jgi:RimJ/RimL family protein N-acetyltransferase